MGGTAFGRAAFLRVKTEIESLLTLEMGLEFCYNKIYVK